MAENQQQDVQCENCGWQGSQPKEMMGRPCPRCGHQALRPKAARESQPAGVSAKLETETTKTTGKVDKK